MKAKAVSKNPMTLGGDPQVGRYVQVCLAERNCSKRDLAGMFLRKLKRRMFGISHEIVS